MQPEMIIIELRQESVQVMFRGWNEGLMMSHMGEKEGYEHATVDQDFY